VFNIVRIFPSKKYCSSFSEVVHILIKLLFLINNLKSIIKDQGSN